MIPQREYEQLLVGVTQKSSDESEVEPVQREKVKLLESESPFKSQLAPFITPKHTSQVQQHPSSPTSLENPQIEELIKHIPSSSQVQVQKIKILLDKFLKNKRLSLSTNGTDTILLDGVDTNINLGSFLFKLQSPTKLTNLEADIQNILNVRQHQMKKRKQQWLTVE